MKRLAIPIHNELLSEYFGQCSFYNLVTLEAENVRIEQLKISLLEDIQEIPLWLAQQGVTDIVAHRMDNRIVNLFSKQKITVFLGIQIESTEKIIDAYKNGTLLSDSKLIQEIIK